MWSTKITPDDPDEDHQHPDDLATARHLHEYPEDIEWEERDDDLLDDARDDILDIDDHVLERRRLQMCHAKTKDEAKISAVMTPITGGIAMVK